MKVFFTQILPLLLLPVFVSVSVLCDVTIERESDLFKFTESQSGFPQNQIDSLLPFVCVYVVTADCANRTRPPSYLFF